MTSLQRGPSPSPSSTSSCTTDLSSLLSLSRLSSLSSQRSLSSWLSNPIQSSSFCRSRSITDFSSLDRWLKIHNDISNSYVSYLSGTCQSCWLFPRIFPASVLPSCHLRFFFNNSALQIYELSKLGFSHSSLGAAPSFGLPSPSGSLTRCLEDFAMCLTRQLMMT